jgi:hypothetical protein
MSPRAVEIFAALAVPPISLGIYLLLAWSQIRAINRGRAFSPIQRDLLRYSTLFWLATIYSMAAVKIFQWPRPLWIVFSLVWAVLLGWIAWYRHNDDH